MGQHDINVMYYLYQKCDQATWTLLYRIISVGVIKTYILIWQTDALWLRKDFDDRLVCFCNSYYHWKVLHGLIFFLSLIFIGRFRYLTLTDPGKVWMPDTFFRNEKQGHFHSILVNNVYVRVFPNGDVLYSIR